MDPKRRHWFQTKFQNTLQVSLQQMVRMAPQQTPYIHKYKAIQSLKQLLQDKAYAFIVQIFLGRLYYEVDQTGDSIRSYQNALRSYISLSPSRHFLQYLLAIYNNLGLVYIERDELEQGFGCLLKAQQLYADFVRNKGDDVYNNRSYKANGRRFAFYYEGGHDHEQIQQHSTLTWYYLAQLYTKIGEKNKAAVYCGHTLQKQYIANKYVPKEFCQNLIGLAEYYSGQKHFAQAQYILVLAQKVLPQGRHRRTRANLHISLGTLMTDFLQCSAAKIVSRQVNEEDTQHVNKRLLLFNNFQQQFPTMVIPIELEGCKGVFRQANTQYKKALEVFVLDGCVTEYVDIMFHLNRLYKSLGSVETVLERQINMIQKRRTLLEPLLTELNPKAYAATWQKILVEVANIMEELYLIKIQQIVKKSTEERIEKSAQVGRELIKYYEMMHSALKEDKDAQKNQEYHRSVINTMINVAKAQSRMLSSQPKVRVEYLKMGWGKYQQVMEYLKTMPKEMVGKFEKEIELTKEMIALMPNKIDRVNYGQMAIID